MFVVGVANCYKWVWSYITLIIVIIILITKDHLIALKGGK